MAETFVTPAWLAAHLNDPTVVAVEASFYLPGDGKDADALFREAHIPGAVRFDVDRIADHSIDLPHMLPDAGSFGRMVGELGISDTDTIVVYDSTDLLGGARAWWMLNHYGASAVRILQGGFAAWRASNLPVEQGSATRPPTSFRASFDSHAVADLVKTSTASETRSAQIIDARSAARYAGSVPEPRPGLRSGHIPNSLNVPWRDLLDANGRMRASAEIATIFEQAGVDLERPLIASCGSGVSAAILLLGLEQLGITDAALYDGSWSEWGARLDLPAETGPARR